MQTKFKVGFHSPIGFYFARRVHGRMARLRMPSKKREFNPPYIFLIGNEKSIGSVEAFFRPVDGYRVTSLSVFEATTK